jgi:hypothetical protein
MDEDTVAVSATRLSSDIYLINIKTMTLTKAIKVSTNLYGLQYVEGEFISVYSGTLRWLSAEGLQLRERKPHMEAWFVRSLGKNSYICEDGTNATSYTKDERKQFTCFSINFTNHSFSSVNRS